MYFARSLNVVLFNENTKKNVNFSNQKSNEIYSVLCHFAEYVYSILIDVRVSSSNDNGGRSFVLIFTKTIYKFRCLNIEKMKFEWTKMNLLDYY